MPQDKEKKAAYEHADHMEKEARASAVAEREQDDEILQRDSHTGQQGVSPLDTETRNAADNKDAIALLSDFHKDEVRRLTLVPTGTRLKTGGAYMDLRDTPRIERIATGEETVDEHLLLVAKHDVDYEIWNKLLGK